MIASVLVREYQLPEPPPSRFPDIAELKGYFKKALEEVPVEGHTTVIALPAPNAPVEQLLSALPMPFGMIWWPPSGWAFSAVGAAHRIQLTGKERLQQLQQASAALFDKMVYCRHPSCNAPPPRLFGGLAFSVDNNDEAWSEFGDGCFMLPRWSYGRRENEAVLTFAVPVAPDAAGRKRAMEEFARICHELDGEMTRSTVASSIARRPIQSIPQDCLTQLDPAIWTAHIEAIQAAIGSGRFEKIVAARRCEIRAPEAIDDLQVFARLGHEYPSCSRFMFRRMNSTFVGASPETLFRKTGTTLTTQALAGSIGLGGLDAPTDEKEAEVRLKSAKNLAEHNVVVREITGGLTPLTTQLDVAPHPSVIKVRNILHLNTPIKGTLRISTQAYQILAALHPTPAVGGVPRWEAVRWILEHEKMGRGWYTGPVGWLDAVDDGEMIVALRCGLVGRASSFVFSGAGVMGDSDPASEYAETALKQQPLLRALGVQI
jgi:isochorismate synthase